MSRGAPSALKASEASKTAAARERQGPILSHNSTLPGNIGLSSFAVRCTRPGTQHRFGTFRLENRRARDDSFSFDLLSILVNAPVFFEPVRQLWSLCLPRQSSCPCIGPVTNLLLSRITDRKSTRLNSSHSS